MAYLARANIGTALLVATVHSSAIVLAGIVMAWLDLDRIWYASRCLPAQQA